MWIPVSAVHLRAASVLWDFRGDGCDWLRGMGFADLRDVGLGFGRKGGGWKVSGVGFELGLFVRR